LGIAYGASNALRGGAKTIEAFHWFSKAASQGHLKSKVQLGDMYHAGIGVEKNMAEAMKWRLEAAEEGHEGSQYTVGQMYLAGQGAMKSRISGFAWIIVAATNDYTPAAAYRRYMDIQGDPKEIAKAEALAKDMISKNPKLLK
jgi:TPR repeat protein